MCFDNGRLIYISISMVNMFKTKPVKIRTIGRLEVRNECDIFNLFRISSRLIINDKRI